jgi:hypothetical protein
MSTISILLRTLPASSCCMIGTREHEYQMTRRIWSLASLLWIYPFQTTVGQAAEQAATACTDGSTCKLKGQDRHCAGPSIYHVYIVNGCYSSHGKLDKVMSHCLLYCLPDKQPGTRKLEDFIFQAVSRSLAGLEAQR